MCRAPKQLLLLLILGLPACNIDGQGPQNPTRVDLGYEQTDEEHIEAPDPNLISTEQLTESRFMVRGRAGSVEAFADVVIRNLGGEFDGLECQTSANDLGSFDCEVSGYIGDEVGVKQIVEGQSSPETRIQLIPEIGLKEMEETGLAGLALENAGDVNGDGVDDLIVGSEAAWINSRYGGFEPTNPGIAYVYSPVCEGQEERCILMRFREFQAGSGFGSVVGTAGDINQDGYDDVLVAAPARKNDYHVVFDFDEGVSYTLDVPDVSSGAVYVFAGGPDVKDQESALLGILIPPFSFDNTSTLSGFFGAEAVGGKDLDGDGVPDFIISGNLNPIGVSGEVYFYSGQCVLDNEVCDKPIASMRHEDVLRKSDIPEEILQDWSETQNWQAYPYLPPTFGLNLEIFREQAQGPTFRLAVSAASIFNAWGLIYVLDLSLEEGVANIHTWLRHSGGTCRPNYGNAMTFLEDLDGDGLPELVIGDTYQSFSFKEGWIPLPRRTSKCQTSYAEAPESGALTGSSTSNSSDELLSDNTLYERTGGLFFYFSNSDHPDRPDISIPGDPLEGLGGAVKAVGDVNGDGHPDIAATSIGDWQDPASKRSISIWSSACPDEGECDRRIFHRDVEGFGIEEDPFIPSQSIAQIKVSDPSSEDVLGNLYFGVATDPNRLNLYDGRLILVSGTENFQTTPIESFPCTFDGLDFGYHMGSITSPWTLSVVDEDTVELNYEPNGNYCAVAPRTSLTLYNPFSGASCSYVARYDGGFSNGGCQISVLTGETIILRYQNGPESFSEVDFGFNIPSTLPDSSGEGGSNNDKPKPHEG